MDLGDLVFYFFKSLDELFIYTVHLLAAARVMN